MHLGKKKTMPFPETSHLLKRREGHPRKNKSKGEEKEGKEEVKRGKPGLSGSAKKGKFFGQKPQRRGHGERFWQDVIG